MTPSELHSISLENFRTAASPPVNLGLIDLERRREILRIIIAIYMVFCVMIYMFLTQIARRNAMQRRARDRKKETSKGRGKKGKKESNVGFDERVLVKRVKDLKATAGPDGRFEDAGVLRLKD